MQYIGNTQYSVNLPSRKNIRNNPYAIISNDFSFNGGPDAGIQPIIDSPQDTLSLRNVCQSLMPIRSKDNEYVLRRKRKTKIDANAYIFRRICRFLTIIITGKFSAYNNWVFQYTVELTRPNRHSKTN